MVVSVSGRLPTGEYYNLGANYLSDDKVAMWDLVDRIGVEMVAHDVGLDLPPVEIFKNFGEPYGIVVDGSDIEEFANLWERIKQGKEDPRPFTDHGLDGVAAQAWVGDLRPNV